MSNYVGESSVEVPGISPRQTADGVSFQLFSPLQLIQPQLITLYIRIPSTSPRAHTRLRYYQSWSSWHLFRLNTKNNILLCISKLSKIRWLVLVFAINILNDFHCQNFKLSASCTAVNFPSWSYISCKIYIGLKKY